MKPVCIIGARGGSKGIPKKNIKILGDKPLIAHTIESSLDSGLFSSVIVSTDDNDIARISKKYGADIPFMRPKRLATDKASMNDVFIHAIKKLCSLNYKFKILVNRDCTVPFIRKKDMAGSIELLEDKKVDMVLGVYQQHHNPYFNMMETNSKGFLRFSKRLNHHPQSRQDAPIVYQVNGLFTFYVDSLLKYKKIYNMPKIIPFEIPPETGLMIDTEFEFQIADFIAREKIKI